MLVIYDSVMNKITFVGFRSLGKFEGSSILIMRLGKFGENVDIIYMSKKVCKIVFKGKFHF